MSIEVGRGDLRFRFRVLHVGFNDFSVQMSVFDQRQLQLQVRAVKNRFNQLVDDTVQVIVPLVLGKDGL